MSRLILTRPAGSHGRHRSYCRFPPSDVTAGNALRLTAVPAALLGLGLFSSSAVYAEATVTSVSPANGANDYAGIGTPISATLAPSNGIATEVFGNSQTFVLHTSQSARGAVTVTGEAGQITAVPTFFQHPGEQLQMTVTDGIQLQSTLNPTIESAIPYVWQFRTEVTVGTGFFIASGNSLSGSRSDDVSLGDVDGDGDLDAFVANRSSLPNRVWLNDGSGVFSASGNSLGDDGSSGVSLGDVDRDGDLDAFVANYRYPNRVWINDGSGMFTDSGNSLGSSKSLGVSLGDVDGDGDLDAFVAPYNYQPKRVWLNDDDTDGDGTPNSADNDDNGDGISDADELAGNTFGGVATDPLDPDTDGDGILDSWDRYPRGDQQTNALGECGGEVATIVTSPIIDPMTCIATTRIETLDPVVVDGDDPLNGLGDLLLIAPTVELNPGFEVEPDGKLTVISADPSEPPP